jgi:Recombination endonuclease VII
VGIPKAKLCPECGKTKPASEFYVRRSGKLAGQLASYCKSCWGKRQRRWRANNAVETKDMQLRNRFRTRYGIILPRGTWQRVMRESQGRCAICREEGVELCLDHDHKTGQLRGMICHPCNRMLGHAADNEIILARAARYLRHYRN